MPIATRSFRVFVSSTFEDLKEERDALQRDVFPKLRTVCEQHGARFQAIDLRWGVRDEAALDQQTMEICLREIRRCQATGVRPNFIVLLGDRYGWQPLPARIPAAEFDALLPHIPAGGARTMATQWYWLDENAVPSEYCLQPRTGEFIALAAWNPVEQTLHQALAKAVRLAGLPEKELVKYETSATHQEILAGLGETEADRQHVFGFARRPTVDSDPRVEELKSLLPVHDFDPVAVYDQLRQVIEAEIKRFDDRPALDLEIEAHDRFAEERCRIFTGRQAVLDAIAGYIRGPERRPLVLHGESGSGKSAVMAKASQQYQGPGRVIRRFIGASPESASGHALLTSLCSQMALGDTPFDYAQLESAFKERLAVAAGEQPVVLFIDALDQLAASDPARLMNWLPPELPPHVKVIVSTSANVERLPIGLPVPLERMTQWEGGRALEEWLREARRTLQPWQRDKVLAQFEHCGLPLYLKLAAEESRLWKSYTSEDACMLGEGVAGVIDTLFDRLASNANHGPTLVERSLGYLAAARYGLAEDEILDVLTEDDTVWSDFDKRKHHEVSERRLPVVVWSRLLLDLEPYLTERAAPGAKVVSFYHRQLAEQAVARFLDGGQRRQRHASMAGYFAARPHFFDAKQTQPNGRKAGELVHQQLGAGLLDGAVATLTDLQFVAASCATGLVFDLQHDYRDTIAALPEAHAELRVAEQYRARAARWTAQITEYAERWSELRHREAQGEKIEELAIPEIIKSVKPRTNQQITADCDHIRANPSKLDQLKVFAGFVESECYPLFAFGQHPGFVGQHAFNHAPAGPVHDAAVQGLDAVNTPMFTRVWSTEARYSPKPVCLRILEGQGGPVNSVSVTPDGRWAASGNSDKALQVWDLEKGVCLHTLEGHNAGVLSVSVTPDGRWAVSASDDKTLRVWDLQKGVCLSTLEGHAARVSSVSLTPDGRRAVSGSGDRTLRVWDLQTGAWLRTLEGHSAWVTSVSVTPDGRRAVSASIDGTLRVWDLESGTCQRTLKHPGLWVNSVSVTPDGRRAVTASEDLGLGVWDLETGRCLHLFDRRPLGQLNGHSDAVTSVSVTPDGRRAVSASVDRTLRVWDLKTGACLRTLEGHASLVRSVSVTPDGRRAMSGSDDKTLRVWDLATAECLPGLEAHVKLVSKVSVTPDARRAISASHDGTMRVWDLATGACLRKLEGETGRIRGMSVTPDGLRAVSGGGNLLAETAMQVWDLETGRCLFELDGHTDAVTSVSVTPDGRRVVSGSRDETLRVWDLETGADPLILRHSDWVTCVSVTPDGRRAVSGSRNKTLRVWNLEKGVSLRTLEGHRGGVTCVSVTPDGRRAVSGCRGRELRVWDLATGQCLLDLKGHRDVVWDVSITPDGRRAISVSRDRTLRAWDMATGACLAVVVGLWTSVACAGPRFVAGTATGEVVRLDLRGIETGEPVAPLPPEPLSAPIGDDRSLDAAIQGLQYFQRLFESLASDQHSFWRSQLRSDERGGPFDRPYEKLDQELKSFVIAKLHRIPVVLALAGFVLEEGEASQEEEEVVCEALKHRFPLVHCRDSRYELGELREQKEREGWTYGPPNKVERTRSLLVPNVEKPESVQGQKKQDLRTIMDYPKYARAAGLKIAPWRITDEDLEA
jgi:WD40 repeat protein